MSWQEIALTPSFWQALGKALGWGESELHAGSISEGTKPVGWWRLHAGSFFDLILTGGDTTHFPLGRTTH
jgi:hypothetical protein